MFKVQFTSLVILFGFCSSVYSASSGEMLLNGRVESVTASSDNRWIAAITKDGYVKIAEADTGKAAVDGRVSFYSTYENKVSFSPRDRFASVSHAVAFYYAFPTHTFYDLQTKAQRKDFTCGERYEISSYFFSNDDKYLALRCYQTPLYEAAKLVILNTESGQVVFEKEWTKRRENDRLYFDVSKQSPLVSSAGFSASVGDYQFANMTTAQRVFEDGSGAAYEYELSLVRISKDGVKAVHMQFPFFVEHFQITPDGKKLLLFVTYDRKPEIRVVDAETGSKVLGVISWPEKAPAISLENWFYYRISELTISPSSSDELVLSYAPTSEVNNPRPNFTITYDLKQYAVKSFFLTNQIEQSGGAFLNTFKRSDLSSFLFLLSRDGGLGVYNTQGDLQKLVSFDIPRAFPQNFHVTKKSRYAYVDTKDPTVFAVFDMKLGGVVGDIQLDYDPAVFNFSEDGSLLLTTSVNKAIWRPMPSPTKVD